MMRRMIRAVTDAELFALADDARRRGVGDGIHIRAIIEFSSFCRQDCLYCGLRRSNSAARRYRMTPAEIVAAARDALSFFPFATFVLQSGEDAAYDARDLAEAVRGIVSLGAVVTLSVGQRPSADYDLWRAAGADRYLLKFETADPDLFARLKPTTTLAERLRCLADLRRLGYQVGTGNIVGLPGQTEETLERDLALLADLDPEMASVSPFVPHPATPLADAAPGTVDDALRFIARTRIALPLAHIPATTALSVIDPRGRERALRAGANVVMVDVTPARYRVGYDIYPGKTTTELGTAGLMRHLEAEFARLGRRIAPGPGHSPKAPWSAKEAGQTCGMGS